MAWQCEHMLTGAVLIVNCGCLLIVRAGRGEQWGHGGTSEVEPSSPTVRKRGNGERFTFHYLQMVYCLYS